MCSSPARLLKKSRAKNSRRSARSKMPAWSRSPTMAIACRTMKSCAARWNTRSMFDLPVMDHCQDYSLVTDGVMHEGYWSTALGLRGWPAARRGNDRRAKYFARRTDRRARALPAPEFRRQRPPDSRSQKPRRADFRRSLPAPFYAHRRRRRRQRKILARRMAKSSRASFPTEQTFPSWPYYDTNFKMNPPLRSAARSRGDSRRPGGWHDWKFWAAITRRIAISKKKSSSITRPSASPASKRNSRSRSCASTTPAGSTLPKLLDKLTVKPAKLLRIEKGTLDIGADGDITIFDPDRRWIYDREQSASKSQNSPFHGWTLRGKALATIVAGKIVWREPNI